MNSIPAAVVRNAWVMGLHGKLLGHPIYHAFNVLNADRPALHAAYILGWLTQHHSDRKIMTDDFQFLFDMNRLNDELVKRIVDSNKRRRVMTTRTADELAALRKDFDSNYKGDDAGREAAFSAHLAELDAAPAAAAPAKKSGGKGAKATAPAKKGGKAASTTKTAPKATKAATAPKAKAFRPASADRQVLNAAAAKVAGKDVKTPRLLPKGSGTYTDFLQGKTLKLDANGNGSTVLNVVSAKDTAKVLGTVTVAVSGGKMKATGAKA